MPTPIALATNVGLLEADEFEGVDWVDCCNKASAALPNGGTIRIGDDLAGNAITIGNIPSNVTLYFTGGGVFGFGTLNVGPLTKIYGLGATLKILQSNSSGISVTNQAILQTNDTLIIQGLKIDGGNLAGTTGIWLGAGTAKVRVRDCEIANCATGVRIDGAQFGSFSGVDVWNCTIGWKNYSIAGGGGGNSNTFLDCKAIGCQVGAIFNDFAGNLGMGPNYWINPSFLDNAICAMAVLGDSFVPTIYWEGGAPESNGQGAASIIVDGQTILNSTIYSNLGRITLRDVAIQDAQVATFLLAQNNSQVIFDNVSGYGVTTGNLVSCDATSKFYPNGKLDCLGLATGLVTWPSAVVYGANLKLLGKPIVIKNALIPNAFTGNAVNIPLSNIIGATASVSIDQQYGSVASVAHGASVGSQDANRWMVPLGTINANVTLSLLIKSNVNCSYRLGIYGNNQSQLAAPLTAGVWQRMVIILNGVTGSPLLVGSPNDATGPTINIAFLQVSLNDEQSYILQSGSINTNGN
jgi:hypothetical protein